MAEKKITIPKNFGVDNDLTQPYSRAFSNGSQSQSDNIYISCKSPEGCTISYTQDDIDSNSDQLRTTGNIVVEYSPRIDLIKALTYGGRYQFNTYRRTNYSQYEYENTAWQGQGEKPTWEEILQWLNGANIQEIADKKRFLEDAFYDNYVGLNYEFDGSYEPNYIRSKLSGGQTVNIDGVETHVHGGVDRMTGLISMVEDANESGETIPLVVMRDENNNPIEIYTQEEIRPILNKVRQRKNIVESAHNKVMQKYQEIVNRRDNQNDSVENRLVAANEGLDFLRDYRNLLNDEIENYDSDALPVNLETLKAVYQERIEARAGPGQGPA